MAALAPLASALIASCLVLSPGLVAAPEDIADVTGKYHFLSADDTLAILEEEGKLKGYIDVYQGEEESDAVLSYPIMLGWRKKDHVEFKTGRIHQKYYRFTGAAERGGGHEQANLDLKTRSLITVAAITALGRANALRLNLEMALNNGASKSEILETLLQMAPYAGFPACWDALVIADEVFKQKK